MPGHEFSWFRPNEIANCDISWAHLRSHFVRSPHLIQGQFDRVITGFARGVVFNPSLSGIPRYAEHTRCGTKQPVTVHIRAETAVGCTWAQQRIALQATYGASWIHSSSGVVPAQKFPPQFRCLRPHERKQFRVRAGEKITHQGKRIFMGWIYGEM